MQPHALTPGAQDNYGKDDDKCIAAVKQLYEELQLQQTFSEYEQESYDHLTRAIQQQSAVPPPVFTLFLQKIYKRTK